MSGSIKSKTNENRGELDRKLMQNGENWCQNPKNLFKLDQLYVHVSLELNMIYTNWYFSAERGGQSNLVALYNRDEIGLTIAQMGVITVEPSYYT